MPNVTYQNKKDGRTQTFDEREKVRASILERSGWFLMQGELQLAAESEGEEAVGAVEEPTADDFTQIAGVGYDMNDALHVAGFRTFADLANADVEKLVEVNGVGKATAAKLRKGAAKIRLEETK